MNLSLLFQFLFGLPMPRDASRAIEINDLLRKLEGCVAGHYIEMRTRHVRVTVQTDDLFNPTVQVFIKNKAVPLTMNVLIKMQELVSQNYIIHWITTEAS